MNQTKFADILVKALMSSFSHAYELHKGGESIDAILIQHDIIAAGSNIDATIIKLHQTAIRSACGAVDARIPLPIAAAYIHERMRQQVARVLKK